jgi:chromosome segregation ATPase
VRRIEELDSEVSRLGRELAARDTELAQRAEELEATRADLQRATQTLAEKDSELRRQAEELASQASAMRQLTEDLGASRVKCTGLEGRLEAAESSLGRAEGAHQLLVHNATVACDALSVGESLSVAERVANLPLAAREQAKQVVQKAAAVVLAHFPTMEVEVVGQGWPKIDDPAKLEEAIDAAEAKVGPLATGLFDLAVYELDAFPVPGEDAPVDDPPEEQEPAPQDPNE